MRHLEQLIKSLDDNVPPMMPSMKALNFYLKKCVDCGFGFTVYSRCSWLCKRCPECKRSRRKKYLHVNYRKTHQKPYRKEAKILDALFGGKKTIEELAGLAGTNQNSVRVTLSNLRKKNHRIVKIGSYYRRLNN